jgi:hypothetical protein
MISWDDFEAIDTLSLQYLSLLWTHETSLFIDLTSIRQHGRQLRSAASMTSITITKLETSCTLLLTFLKSLTFRLQSSILTTTMPTGSCLCGEIKIEYIGEPTYTACPPAPDQRERTIESWQKACPGVLPLHWRSQTEQHPSLPDPKSTVLDHSWWTKDFHEAVWPRQGKWEANKQADQDELHDQK